MTSTKKGFLYAGTILGIIEAALLLLVGLIFAFAPQLVTLDLIKEVIAESEEAIVLTDEEIIELIPIIKGYLVFLSVTMLGMGIATLIVSTKLLKLTKVGVFSKKLTITLLVFAVLLGRLGILAFMIVALCLKNKPKQKNNDNVTTIEV